jgi:phosphatidylglycerol lysyltransferase
MRKESFMTRDRWLTATEGPIQPPLSNPAEYARARELVIQYGWNSTAYQILNPGISLWFSEGSDAVIGYVEFGRTLVVAGAPVCDITRLDAVTEEFTRAAHERGRGVCYFGAGDRLETRYAANKRWSRVLLGAQPSWDPHEWRTAVGQRSSVRAQFNRARNKGVRITEWESERAENNPQLRRCLAEWLSTRNLPPLHFLVEPETLSRMHDRRVFVATRDGFDGAIAFTVLSPVPARNGWLFEQIVRGHNAPNGTAELLIDVAMQAVASSGATYGTLGLSPLSERGAIELRQPLWLRLLLRWLRRHGTRFYNFRGLDAFKAKFNPQVWEPIYAIAEGKNFPPRALYAIAGAFSGGAPIRLVARALMRAALEEISSLIEKVAHTMRRLTSRSRAGAPTS